MVRVRFAPSPTGELHIGGVRTALFNWLFVRHLGGKMILRIDDTDQERSSDRFLQTILDSMLWLGLDWDEGPRVGGEFGPYFQTQRQAFYQEEIDKLLESGGAYLCFCTPEELTREKEENAKKGLPPRYSGACRNLSPQEIAKRKEAGEPYVIRLRVPEDGETVVDDLIRGRVVFENKIFDDFIIVKSDGLPTYNFASAIDDARMKITHVIRAEEHLSNTPRQQIICGKLGLGIPAYAHVPMILAPDHSKLSKRHGATSVQEYKEMGILPEALVNYLALLGWSPGGDREIMEIEEMIKLFSLERVGKNASIYDLKKLTWINSHYLRSKDKETIGKLAAPFLQKDGLISQEEITEKEKYIEDIVDLVREKVKTLQEVADASVCFFKDEFPYDEAEVAKHFGQEGAGTLLKEIEKTISEIEPFQKDAIKEKLKSLSEELKLSPGKINIPLRLAITGRTMGPDLLDVLTILGKDKIIKRLQKL